MGKITDWFRSWRLLSLRSALVAALLAYAVVGFLVVPRVVHNLIIDLARERTGRDVTVEEVRCNPFALSLTVRGFSMPDIDGSVLLSFDELYANAQASSLFRWALTLEELRIENPSTALRRFSDGRINVLELMADIEERTPTEDEDAEDGGLPRAVLHHILVSGSSIDIADLARDEPLQMTLGPSRFELFDISTIPEKQGVNDFVIALLEGGTIGVDGEVVVEPLGLSGAVRVENLSLERAWPVLKPFFQFDLVGGTAGGHFDYSVRLEDDGLRATISDLDYELVGMEVKVRDHDQNVLEVPKLTIEDLSVAWPEAAVGVGTIAVTDAEAFVWLEPDGTPSWAELVPKETQQQVVEAYQTIEEAFPWKIAIDRFEIAGASAEFEDRTFAEPLVLTADGANLALTDIATGPGHQWGLEASARLLDEAAATASGSVGTGPMRLDETEVSLENLDLARFQPYLERIAPIELRAGQVRATGRIAVDPRDDTPLARFAGDMAIEQIDLRETVVGSEILKWGRVETTGIDASVQPMAATIAAIDIHEAGIEVVVSEDGRVNLIELFGAMAEQTQSEGSSTEATSEMPAIDIGTVTLHGCSSAYSDRTVAPPFTMALDPVDGTVRNISSSSASGAALDVEAAVRSGGMVKLDGEMDLLDPKRLTRLGIDVRQAAMPPASPMSVRTVGFPIEEGVIDIGLEYDIADSALTGSNRFVTDGLALGDKVEGEGMIDLPLKLGVSLLTDKNGLITLEFPTEGNLDDPAFGIGSAIGSATKEIMSELVKSPFRMLSKLGGGSGEEDLGFVEFEAGSADLEVTAVDKLATLAAGAEQRPQLVLQVAGVWDPEVDALGLKEAAFHAVLEERLGTATSGDGESAASLELMESVATEVLGAEQVAALKSAHTTAAPAGDAGESAAAPAVDETAYYRDLRTASIEAQPVNQAAVEALGPARGEAIRSYLVNELGVDPGRVELLAPVPVEESSGDGWVRCPLDVAAE